MLGKCIGGEFVFTEYSTYISFGSGTVILFYEKNTCIMYVILLVIL
jgi:hypothetical protein